MPVNVPKFLTHRPLERCRVTQPYGVDWTNGQLPLPGGGQGGYSSLGLKAHNGVDFSLYPHGSGTPVFAPCDGRVEVDPVAASSGYGLNVRLFRKLGPQPDGSGLEAELVFGHLQEVRKTGEVKAGDLIALGDSTGISTGPHLHFGLRFRRWTAGGSGPYFLDYDNGFFGYVDPMPFFSADPTLLPVDCRYGLPEGARGYSDVEWYKVAAWLWFTMKRLPTTREKNALVWGRWDWRSLNDPSMFATWTEMTKMEWMKRTKK
ncbi:MAG: M23 family metallopeptidase [Bacteroidales bacterium]|jgi:hypothetical protein|nr:M23 family metallopeptidase [Sphaerochaeta sp.]MCK9629623.1 M23 family metallopeptidase [Bacteroidales bacterium]